MVPILIFVMLALGLNIVVGYAGLLDLGYAAFFAIGAYTAAFLTSPQSPLVKRGIEPTSGWRWWSAAVVAALFGVILGRADAAAARRLPGDRDAGVRRDRAARLPQPGELTGGSKGLNPIGRPQLLGDEWPRRSRASCRSGTT